jgi:lauroyl/myristoyl acyltransferase
VIRVRPPAARWPFDLLRLVFEATLRDALPPEEPEILRFLAGFGWRFEERLTVMRGRLMAEEARRCFDANVRTASAIVREANDLALQARMERLVLPRLSHAQMDAIVRVEGTLSTPALLLFPHAGNVDLLVAAVAQRWPGLVVFTGRDPAVSADGARLTPFAREVLRRREEDRARLPIRWEPDAAALPGWLARGHLVAAAFDDRAWPTFVRTPFLGREALLSPDPFALARAAGVPIVPATIRRERDKTSRLMIGPPTPPDLGAYVRDHATPFLRTYPGHYARWLAECRMREGQDDHPLFTDYADDGRWRRWPVA